MAGGDVNGAVTQKISQSMNLSQVRVISTSAGVLEGDVCSLPMLREAYVVWSYIRFEWFEAPPVQWDPDTSICLEEPANSLR